MICWQFYSLSGHRADAFEPTCSRSIPDDQLRVAFGVPVQRKLTRQGFRVGHLHYWSEELIPHFLRGPWLKDKAFTIYWWAPKIGAITVELPDGSSVQAQCTDPKWHGKSHDDVLLHMKEAAHLDDLAIEAKDKAIFEIDAFSHRKAQLAGLVPHQPKASDLNYLEKKFSRYMTIPSRKLAGMMGIFGDEIIPERRTDAPQARPLAEQAVQNPITSANTSSDKDLME